MLRVLNRVLLVGALISCGPAACRETDVSPDAPAPRVVSFSPALTDILFAMGFGDHVVGVTTFCQLPPGETREVVGDRTGPSKEKMLLVRPDVILIQQDPATFAGIRGGMPDVKIEHFVIEKLNDISAAMERIARIVGDEGRGREHREQFERRLAGVRKRVEGLPRPKVYFLQSFSPLSVAGRASFIHEMIEIAGGDDLSGQYERWAQINVERLLNDRPEIIICQALPNQADDAKRYLTERLVSVPAAASGRVLIVTDRRWTIPSSHVAELTEMLAEMIHPEAAPEGEAH